MTTPNVLRAVAIPALIVTLTGCASDPNDVSFDALTNDLTPHILGISERDVDMQRNMAVIENQNMRMMWGDFGRFFLWDAPSRLSPYDIISTGGQPSQ
tara:strand:+ start:379 stop:672 length:294 start_codon:yes stop_codon:yes gene_type:complete